MESKKIVAAAAAIVMGFGLGSLTVQAKTAKSEKCYGIVKAGKNACGNSRHSCAAQAKTDNEPDEWIFLPKGSCEKITGGSLTPKKAEEAGASDNVCTCPPEDKKDTPSES